MISRAPRLTQRESSAVVRFVNRSACGSLCRKMFDSTSTEMSDLIPEIKGGFKSTHKPNFTAVVCTEFVHNHLQFYHQGTEGGVVTLSLTLLLE